MKKLMFVLTSTVLLTGLLASCGQKKPEPQPQPTTPAVSKAPKVDVYVLRKEPDPAPEWVYGDDWVVTKDSDGKKVIYFKVQSAQRPTLEKAMYDVKSEKGVLLAGIIKQLTSVEMVKATEGMLNDQGDLDTYFSQTAASISRNVSTGGVLGAGSYWEYVQEVEGEQSKKYYRVVKRYKMDYSDFKARLMNAVKKEPRINEKLKNKSEDFLNKMNAQLDAQGE